MALSSMTGFARASGAVDGAHFAWEMKSVNGKGLEIRLRMPPGLERLEQPVRAAVQKRFSRGNIQINLTVSRTEAAVLPVVNRALLDELARLSARLVSEYGAAPATADGLLSIRGVLEIPEQEETDEARATFDTAALSALDEAIADLADVRGGEGAALADVLLGQLSAIEALTLTAEADPSREAGAIAERLGQQVRQLMGASQGLDEARLHAEAAFLATKADIREEIDRLKTHVAAARALIGSDGPVGRKLDFLAQEFNRESNTLCSKSNAAAVTAIGLELKVVIDQFREQIQNIE